MLSSNKERLIAGYNRRRDLCLDANRFVSLTANSLIEVICLKIWQNHCPKKQNVLFPLTCCAQNRLSWLGSLLQQESLECTLSTFSWTGVSLLPSTTAIDDCHRDASCSLNRAVSCSWSFKEQKEQNEIKTRLINCYRCKIKTVVGVIIRGSIYNVQYKSWLDQANKTESNKHSKVTNPIWLEAKTSAVYKQDLGNVDTTIPTNVPRTN